MYEVLEFTENYHPNADQNAKNVVVVRKEGSRQVETHMITKHITPGKKHNALLKNFVDNVHELTRHVNKTDLKWPVGIKTDEDVCAFLYSVVAKEFCESAESPTQAD